MVKRIRVISEEQLREGVAKGLGVGSNCSDTPCGKDGEMYAEREEYLVLIKEGKGTLAQALAWIKKNGYTNYSMYPIY